MSISKIPPGHYTLDSLAKELDRVFDKHEYRQLETKTNQPVGQHVIKNFGAKPITLDRDLANLFGIKRNLKIITHTSQRHILFIAI